MENFQYLNNDGNKFRFNTKLYYFTKDIEYITSSPDMNMVENLILSRKKRDEIKNKINSIFENNYYK